jgi:hypothetical protein
LNKKATLPKPVRGRKERSGAGRLQPGPAGAVQGAAGAVFAGKTAIISDFAQKKWNIA